MSYNFNYYSVYNYKNYGFKVDTKMIQITNEKDSTYSLHLDYNTKEAILKDTKNKLLVKFKIDFNFEKIEDLEKLTNSRLFKNSRYVSGRKFKNFVQDFEFGNDTINHKTIVHLTSYKNKKRKKIINEHFYYFGNENNNIYDLHEKSIKKYLINKYDLEDIKDLNIEKILCLKDGKIESQMIFSEIKKVNYNFKFKIDEEFPN
ncbi:hypothetical protein [Flavobacterium sp.]|uniref:hypothetical protein n=1 Tax=Flavobacterium sp. TaxID=239 RepID=UPI003751B31C